MSKNNNILKVGIAGLGTVGQGVFKILTEKKELFKKRTGKEIVITAVSARDKSKDRGLKLDGVKWYDNAADLANDADVDCVVEVIGGAEGTPSDLVFNALKNGKHVVTANKALIARKGVELAKLAEEKNLALQFEASVAGGIPIIKALKEGLAANEVSEISGILNGTCNFILTKMEAEKRTFDDVLKEAQKLGYAEADPSFDVDGMDAAHKLVILSALSFGIKPSLENTFIDGIRRITLNDISYADKLGYKIKLLGIAEKKNGKVEQRVRTCLVDKKKEIANVNGVLGAVEVMTDSLGAAFFSGAGAGMLPTASAVVADIIDIANGKYIKPFVVSYKDLEDAKFTKPENHTGEYYLRFSTKDVDGVLSSITSILTNNGIGFGKIHQETPKAGEADVVMITHDVKEEKIKKSLAEIAKQSYIVGEPLFVRVEKV